MPSFRCTLCDVPHQIWENVPSAIYVEAPLNQVDAFKAVRAPLGPKRTISTWMGAGGYKWYQSRSPTPLWGFVWPRKECLSVWPRNPMGHNEDVVSAWGGVCDVPHRIGENVPGTLYIETPLNPVDTF